MVTRRKKPLTPCAQCKQSLGACRAQLATTLTGKVEAEARLDTARAELRAALEELAAAKAYGSAPRPQREQRLLADVQLYQRIQAGDIPWLIKDFNVLYRVAQRLLDTLPVQHAGEVRGRAAGELRAQLERLKPAFTDTEEVRELARQRGQRGVSG